MNKKNCYQTGVTFLEMILVLVMVAVGAALAVPKLRMSVEHREAKAALETLRSISHAIRMYEVAHKGVLPDSLNVLETTDVDMGTRYLDPSEYAFSPPYVYDIPTLNPSVVIQAHNANVNRTITLTQCGAANKSKDGAVTDSAGFLNSPTAC
jgi:type II secretory pathway pseudopilin PulG